MNKLIEQNLQKQINKVMQQIRNCKEDEFEPLVYKYNVFNDIKNTFNEEIIEVGEFKELLEQDKNILEKIYNKFLNINIIFAPKTFDAVMLETFLNESNLDYKEIKEKQKKELIDIFKEAYKIDAIYNGMIPVNATILQNYSLTLIYDLIKDEVLQKRNCSGLAFEFTDDYKKQLEKENSQEKFSSNTYKGIYYCVMDDCDENKDGYYIEFYRDLQDEYGGIDFDERLDYMIIHVDDEYEMSNPKKVVEEHIDNLIIELERKEELQDEEII